MTPARTRAQGFSSRANLDLDDMRLWRTRGLRRFEMRSQHFLKTRHGICRLLDRGALDLAKERCRPSQPIFGVYHWIRTANWSAGFVQSSLKSSSRTH